MRWFFLLTVAVVGCGEGKADMQEVYRKSYTERQDEWIRSATVYALLKEHPELVQDDVRGELMEAAKKKCLEAAIPWSMERRRWLFEGGDGGPPTLSTPSATPSPTASKTPDPTT